MLHQSSPTHRLYGVTLTLSMTLAACGGGSSNDLPPPSPPASEYTVGGTLSGLTSGMSLALKNGTDNLTLSTNGPFTFATKLANNVGYAVTVLTQPIGQTCALTHPSGTINGANVADVGVTCTDNPPTLAERTAAANTTANNNPLCTAIAPFHWSLGDDTGRLAEGVTGTGGPDALTDMNIASASKLLYGAWVAEQRGGVLTAEDMRYLNFTSGYTGFSGVGCLRDQTVAQCQSYQTNGDYAAADDGKFNYNGGHMQKHAVLMGLGPDANTALATDISAALGNIGITYSQPQLAGGVVTNATEYGKFLQRTVAGQTKIAALLGTHPVCTNPLTCANAVYTPIPSDESWHYSVGHWVEDDPVVGDGAFSSPGAFGFYPWISADKKWWGIVARKVNGGAIDSMRCGREIRAAWVSAKAR